MSSENFSQKHCQTGPTCLIFFFLLPKKVGISYMRTWDSRELLVLNDTWPCFEMLKHPWFWFSFLNRIIWINVYLTMFSFAVMENYKNVPQYFYGLTPSQMDMFMTEDNPISRQSERVTEVISSKLPNLSSLYIQVAMISKRSPRITKSS